MNENLVVIRGGGDMATGIACRLYNSGFKVLITEIENPSVIRRTVSFAEAVYEKEALVEGISGRMADTLEDALTLADNGIIPVLIDPELNNFKHKRLHILVDAIIAKKNLDTSMDMADVVIGVGPGFTTGVDVHAVVETKRGHNLGRMILDGSAEPNTGVPGNIGGYTTQRVIKSPEEGQVRVVKDIGSIVESGDIIAFVGDNEVKTEISGVLRGMIKDGFYVSADMKMADVDPRAAVEHCFSVSDKARAIGGGVLEAIFYFTRKVRNK